MALNVINVVAAVIQKEGKYLLCRRPLHKHHGGRWEFPGGKCEPDEAAVDALGRELLEELELTVLAVSQCAYSGAERKSPYLIFFHPVIVSGELVLHEHIEYRWGSIEEVCRLNLAPVDRNFVNFLISEGGI